MKELSELVVKGLYSAPCYFDFPRSEFPVNIPMTLAVLFTTAIGSTSLKKDLRDNILIFLRRCSSFENFPAICTAKFFHRTSRKAVETAISCTRALGQCDGNKGKRPFDNKFAQVIFKLCLMVSTKL